MPTIDRKDMMEITRRMTVSRTDMLRIAGCYFDQEGIVDGTFNTNFLNLTASQKSQNLSIAKTIPFSDTNKNLRRYKFGTKDMRQLLLGIKSSGLKNDALLDIFYEIFAERYQAVHDYAVYFYYSIYDIPLKTLDRERVWESEEIYEYLICAVCPVNGNYNPGKPECGFIYPVFCNRMENSDCIDIYQENPERPHNDILKILGLYE